MVKKKNVFSYYYVLTITTSFTLAIHQFIKVFAEISLCCFYCVIRPAGQRVHLQVHHPVAPPLLVGHRRPERGGVPGLRPRALHVHPLLPVAGQGLHPCGADAGAYNRFFGRFFWGGDLTIFICHVMWHGRETLGWQNPMWLCEERKWKEFKKWQVWYNFRKMNT